MLDQSAETNPRPFIPVFAAQVISGRKPTEVFIFPHMPCGDLPMLEPWYPCKIFGSIDHSWRKAILLGRVFLDDVVNIIPWFWR